MRGVTIYDVAREAGVSPSTVSNFLNGRRGRMLPVTHLRVADAIQRLGYRPNRAARHLRTGQIQVIGLVVPSVANPFWGTFARHLEGAALAEGYGVLLCNSGRDPDRERKYIEQMWDDGIRGIVLCSSLLSLSHLQPFVDNGLALVAFDRTAQADDPGSLVNISVDNVVGEQLATRHLLDLGHRRIAFVSGSLASVNRMERFRGFAAALAEYGLAVDDTLVWSGPAEDPYGDLDASGLGRTAALDLLRRDNRPTAVVAINDMCALGIFAGIRDAGLRVGTDVSVVGFDDIVLADLANPALTTVRQPVDEMAANAFSQLRQCIDGAGSTAGRSLLVRPELIIRASTCPPPAVATGRRRA